MVGNDCQVLPPSLEYCQPPNDVPLWAEMATPTEMLGASRKALPKTAVTVSPARLEFEAEAGNPSTGVKLALIPDSQVGAGFTKLTGIDAVAVAVLNADAPPVFMRANVVSAAPAVSSQARYFSVAEPLVLVGRLSADSKRSCAALDSRNADVLETLGSAVHVEPLSHCQVPSPESAVMAMPDGTDLPSASE